MIKKILLQICLTIIAISVFFLIVFLFTKAYKYLAPKALKAWQTLKTSALNILFNTTSYLLMSLLALYLGLCLTVCYLLGPSLLYKIHSALSRLKNYISNTYRQWMEPNPSPLNYSLIGLYLTLPSVAALPYLRWSPTEESMSEVCQTHPWTLVATTLLSLYAMGVFTLALALMFSPDPDPLDFNPLFPTFLAFLTSTLCLNIPVYLCANCEGTFERVGVLGGSSPGLICYLMVWLLSCSMFSMGALALLFFLSDAFNAIMNSAMTQRLMSGLLTQKEKIHLTYMLLCLTPLPAFLWQIPLSLNLVNPLPWAAAALLLTTLISLFFYLSFHLFTRETLTPRQTPLFMIFFFLLAASTHLFLFPLI